MSFPVPRKISRDAIQAERPFKGRRMPCLIPRAKYTRHATSDTVRRVTRGTSQLAGRRGTGVARFVPRAYTRAWSSTVGTVSGRLAGGGCNEGLPAGRAPRALPRGTPAPSP